MKFFNVIFLTFFSIITFATATGPPVDYQTGKMFVNSVILNLDSAQLLQVSRTWAFELNDEQLKQIQKYNKKLNIKILDVLTFPYYDCNCDAFVYAVWNKPNSVALPIKFIKDYNTRLKDMKIDEGKEIYNYYKNRTFEDVVKRLGGNEIFIDLDGRAFIKNKEATEADINKLIDSLRKINKTRKKHIDGNWISFSTAPFVSKQVKKLILSKITSISRKARKRGVECADLVKSKVNNPR